MAFQFYNLIFVVCILLCRAVYGPVDGNDSSIRFQLLVFNEIWSCLWVEKIGYLAFTGVNESVPVGHGGL